jgi:RNA polymerase sigma-70 factor (ECF subfamily)
MIVRNEFYSRVRRAWRTTSLDPVVAERILVANDNPTAALELDEMRRALAQLPPEQREALTLIGAGGFAYDEVAGMCGVAVGTVKSRVSRARDQLALIFAENSFGRDNMPAGAAMKSIMADVEGFRAARCA